jgi:IS605 OrfB family transposase
MRKVIHGIVYFEDQSRVLQLMKSFCSCKRSAYQATHKHKLSGNDVKKYCKKNYMTILNQRYIADAAVEASKITKEHALFGNRKLWKKLQDGKISKKKWQHVRNSQLYSRGDKTKNGNPNIRIAGDMLLINDPLKRGLWLTGKLWLQEEIKSDCYEVRIEARNNKFKITVAYDVMSTPIVTDRALGSVGVDCNPDGAAVSELNDDGNLIKHFYLKNDKIRFARSGKRQNAIREMAKRVVAHACGVRKPIILERLQFSKKHKGKKFNRMSHNFIWKQLLDSIKSRASKFGVEVIEVPAAYTSIVGKLKFMQMYSIPIHNAAALVIGRMGLGIIDKVVASISETQGLVTLEARSKSVTLKKKSFLWLKSKFRVCQKQPALTVPGLEPMNNRHKTLVPSKDGKVIESNNWSDSCQKTCFSDSGAERTP